MADKKEINNNIINKNNTNNDNTDNDNTDNDNTDNDNTDNNKINIIKPFLKWVGGKTQIINTLIEYYPKKMNNYHDIFLGGGSTLLALLSYVNASKIKISNKIYAYDINNELINVYKNIQIKPRKLYKKLKEITNEYLKCDGDIINRKPMTIDEAMTSRESYYYWIRNEYNNLSDDEKTNIIGSALFIFLNKTCFRGIYRIGPNGFNVPYGHYKKYNMIKKNILLEISELIKYVKFKCLSFENSITKIKYGDFAYLDPPYVPEKSTSFVKYNLDGFSDEQHKKLFKMCETLRLNKIKFMMSNSNIKLVIDAFPENKYLIEVIECRRAIHSKNPAKKTNEIIIKTF